MSPKLVNKRQAVVKGVQKRSLANHRISSQPDLTPNQEEHFDNFSIELWLNFKSIKFELSFGGHYSLHQLGEPEMQGGNKSQ